MKFIGVLIAFTLSLTNTFAQDKTNLNQIREELFYTDFDIDKCNSFYLKLVDLKQITPTITAYEAAAKALVAKHSWNPITKITSIRESMNLLSKAVDLDKMNLEIRFLRLYIENSLPDYLGMKDNIDEDKQMIIGNIHKLDNSDLNADIVRYIVDYLSTSLVCTTDELKVIQARLL